MRNYTFLVLLFLLFSACKSNVLPAGKFDTTLRQNPPDYSNLYYWAAHPDKVDLADNTVPTLQNEQKDAPIDVFFLYPTIYTGSKKYQTNWNAPVDYEPFNTDVDKSAIKFQASVFNAVGKIYAPRYRQAHIKSYYLADKESCKKAFDFAYEDVKTAFEYYLKNHNNGRPIIIASHSQGTTHAMRLVKEYFDGKPLQNKLVVAYLVGIPVPKNYFTSIEICDSPEKTTCFCTWRTFEYGHEPKKIVRNNIAVVNPLTWKTDDTYAPATLNQGGVIYDYKKIRKGFTDAQIHDGILWAHKPRFRGSILLRTKNYHPGDFNFYYMNVRENAKLREGAFWKR
jgi:Protein of unknown function (DUF3089)